MEVVKNLLCGHSESSETPCLRFLLGLLRSAPFFTFGQKHESVGVYCLYYNGRSGHHLYNGLSNEIPLYIGKASGQTASLESRLREHARSIEEANDLNVADFCYKLVEMKDEWVSGCEEVLINHFRPLWNTVLTGFGNHAPGKGRKNQRKSLWDTLHDGRRWARNFDPELPYDRVCELALEWCTARGFPPHHSITFDVMDHF